MGKESPGKENTAHPGPADLRKSGLEPGVGRTELRGTPWLLDHPASQKPSPAWSQSPLGCIPNQCPGPGREREGWESPTSWATKLEMRTARLTRPFWALGCSAPVLLAFLAGAAMEDLAAPSLPALGPKGPASVSPAPEQQSQPRLCPRDWRPGSQGSLWHEARVAGAGPQGWGHPGSEHGQQPA